MPKIGLKIRSRDLETLIKLVQSYNPEADVAMMEKAYHFADHLHEGQKRLSGEPYMIHPLEVGIILADLKLDPTTIIAALLHDVVEDTRVTLGTLEEEFSKEVAEIVDGLTKISSIKNRSKASAQAETLRKMLLATIKDSRVIIVKLADKLHNMRTLMFHPEYKQKIIAQETLDIYAPMARRLGISKINAELEDLAFEILYPTEYQELEIMLTNRRRKLEKYFEELKTKLKEEISHLGLEVEITGRVKHNYSIFKKMQIEGKQVEEIYDIRGMRIVTKEIKDCYAILGIVHTLWSPIAARFKDYIAVPKTNMYQSLHTTIIGPEGFPVEVQIRTKEMHETAEMGIAAHWFYKEKPDRLKRKLKEVSLFKDASKFDSKISSSREFMTNLKMDLRDKEIFVFTPKGKIIKLSHASTPVDFAYAIHTEVGNHISGAKVNNKMVSIKKILRSGDIIEILTTKKSHPSETWLKFVRSSNARYKIRNWLKKNSDLVKQAEEKKENFLKEKKEKKTVEVLVPKFEELKLKNLNIKKKSKDGVSIDGTSNIMIKLSQCCQPIPGDEVVGFITRGRGVTIHKKSCAFIKNLKEDQERLINIVWNEKENIYYPIKLAVEAFDRPNLLKDVADQISLCKTNILKAEVGSKGKEVDFKFILEVNSNHHMNSIINKIKQLKNVTDVYKLDEKVILK